MKRTLAFLGTLILCAMLLVGSNIGTANAGTSLYQCVYHYYPYSEIWTTNGNYAVYLDSQPAWSCVKWR